MRRLLSITRRICATDRSVRDLFVMTAFCIAAATPSTASADSSGSGRGGAGAIPVPDAESSPSAATEMRPSWRPLISRTADATPYLRARATRHTAGQAAETSDETAAAGTDGRPGNAAPAQSAAIPTDDASVQAAPSPATAPPLTLEQLVAIALSNNPSIPQAAATARKAMGVARQVGLYPNPTIGYQGQEMGDDGTAGMQGAFLNQTIVLGDKLAWNRNVAQQEVQALLWQVESQRYRVRNDVRRQFYETLGAQERLKLAAELHRIADEGLRNTQVLHQAQQAALPDVLQAKVQLQEVDIIRRNAVYQYEASWRRLAALVGWPAMEPVELQPVLFDEQPVRDWETAWAQIVSLSPQLRQAIAEVRRARARIGRERVQPVPNLQVQLGVMHMNVSDDNAASVMLGLPVPLLNANEGNIERAAADFQRASQNVRRLELSLQSELAESYQAYQQALNRVETFAQEILPAQAETLDLIEQAYPLQFDFLRLLTARRMYYEARLEYLEAVIELRQAEVTLDGLLLSGGLNDVPDTGLDDGLRGSALGGQ